MAERSTGEGKARWSSTEPRRIELFNFNIEGHKLKEAHIKFIDTDLVEILQKGASITIVGMTDSLGSTAYNQGLSERRVASTLSYLNEKVPAGFKVREKYHRSEYTALENIGDNKKDEIYRAVHIYPSKAAAPKPVTPKPALPKKRIIQREFSKMDASPTLQHENEWADILKGLMGLLKSIVNNEDVTWGAESTTLRKTGFSPGSHGVVRVWIHKLISLEQTPMGSGAITTYRKIIKYDWGIEGAYVEVNEKVDAVFYGNSQPSQEKNRKVPRHVAEQDDQLVPPDP